MTRAACLLGSPVSAARARSKCSRSASNRSYPEIRFSRRPISWSIARIADGFLSLFQTKLILTGIADSHTLEAISLALGEYDRNLISHTLARTETHNNFLEHRTPPTQTESVTYQTGRQRTLPPGDIARLPPQHGLLLRGTHWGLLRLTPWHRTRPWVAVAEAQTADVQQITA